MGDLKFLDQYAGQSTDELIALESAFRIDSLVLAFEEALDRKVERYGEEQLTDEERVILAIEALEREVNNGGYDQFFQNTSKEYAPIVVAALKKIGCMLEASLTEEAIQALGIIGPVTVEAIDQVMGDDSDERDAKLNACDRRYYNETGDIAGVLWGYIKRNRSKIEI
jgi:hypothetical protein